MSPINEELATLARARVGHTLRDKYRIDDLLGVGGMAAVYSATHRNGREVAVKILHPLLAMHADIRKRFLLEGHAANAVKHPAVVAVLDDDIDVDGTTFLVMERLHGQSLEELWESCGQRLPPDVVLTIAAELCEALTVAHESGIVHRDLKPANLFLTTSGEVKMLDFGLARLRDVALGMTTTTAGSVFGTPAFLPPEQAAGRTSAVDARTDIWALGATMFTLLSGYSVHGGESAQNLILNAATRRAPSLATVLHDAPSLLVGLVDRALAFQKDRRWTTAREMGDAIRYVSEALFGTQRVDLAAVAKPVRNPPPLPQSMLESSPMPRRRAVGIHTTAPVSSSAKESEASRRARAGSGPTASIRDRSSRFRRGLVASGLVAASLVVLMVAGRAVVTSASPESSANGSHADLAISEANEAVSPAEMPAPPRLDERAMAAGSSPAAPQPGPTPAAPRPTAAARAALAKPGVRRATAASPLKTVGKGSCDRPYDVDSSGKRIWKPECL